MMGNFHIIKDLENKKFVIEFEVDTAKANVWHAYADKDWFEKWWGPEGWETTAKEFNFVPGGSVHYGMKCVDERQGEWFGQTSWGVMKIEEVNAEDWFSYRDYFSDETGKLDTNMPALLVKNEFFEKDGTTKIVSTSFADSAEQIKQLIEMGMVDGFKSQLGKLDELVK